MDTPTILSLNDAQFAPVAQGPFALGWFLGGRMRETPRYSGEYLDLIAIARADDPASATHKIPM
jgi:hypothetical protein